MLAERTDVIYAPVRSGVELVYVCVMSADGSREDAGYRSLACASRAGKEEGVSDALVGNRIFESGDDMILTDDFCPFARAVCAV